MNRSSTLSPSVVLGVEDPTGVTVTQSSGSWGGVGESGSPLGVFDESVDVPPKPSTVTYPLPDLCPVPGTWVSEVIPSSPG